MCIITSPRLPRRRRLKTAPNNLKITLDDVLLDQTNHDSSSSHSFETMSLDQTNHQSKTRMCFDPDEDAQEHSPQHQPSKKSVNFYERVIVRPILHVDDYTDEEWKKCWYLPTDKARRKDEIRAALRSIQEGKFGGCARGLEKMADNGVTKERRATAIREILDEQEAQRARARANNEDTVVYDTVKFRLAYRPYSRASRHVAQAMGKIDEMAATSQKIVRQTPKSPLRMKRDKKSVIACVHSNDYGKFLQLDFARN